jgi:hypothetical protein
VADIEYVPGSSQRFVPEGLVVAAPEGLTANDTRYWVFQLAVAVLGLSIVIAFEGEVVPEASPLQPVKTY